MIADALAAAKAAFEKADAGLYTGEEGDAPGPCRVLIGSDPEKHRPSAPPRILLVADRGSITTRDVPRGGEPGAIARRDVNAVAHIWGKTLSQTERMFQTFAGAAHAALSAYSFAPLGEDWTQGDPSIHGVNGELLYFTFRISIPLTRLPSTFAKANQAVLSGSITSPGS